MIDGRRESLCGDRIYLVGLHRQPEVAGPPLHGVSTDLSVHPSGKSRDDCAHLDQLKAPHPHVLLHQQPFLLRCQLLHHHYTQHSDDLCGRDKSHIVHSMCISALPVLHCSDGRMLPPGRDGI